LGEPRLDSLGVEEEESKAVLVVVSDQRGEVCSAEAMATRWRWWFARLQIKETRESQRRKVAARGEEEEERARVW
jgi:hypothetical protein